MPFPGIVQFRDSVVSTRAAAAGHARRPPGAARFYHERSVRHCLMSSCTKASRLPQRSRIVPISKPLSNSPNAAPAENPKGCLVIEMSGRGIAPSFPAKHRRKPTVPLSLSITTQCVRQRLALVDCDGPCTCVYPGVPPRWQIAIPGSARRNAETISSCEDMLHPRLCPNDSRNRAAAIDIDFKTRVVGRSGSRPCSPI